MVRVDVMVLGGVFFGESRKHKGSGPGVDPGEDANGIEALRRAREGREKQEHGSGHAESRAAKGVFWLITASTLNVHNKLRSKKVTFWFGSRKVILTLVGAVSVEDEEARLDGVKK